MKLVVGAEKSAEVLKDAVIGYLESKGYQVVDANRNLNDVDDLTEYIEAVVYSLKVNESADSLGIIISSDPIVLMAANRLKGVRAGVAWDEKIARQLRQINDANILCLPLKLTERNSQLWKDIIEVFVNTKFEASERAKRRNARLDELL